MTLEYDESRYIPIIDNILRKSDLTKISSKRVRRGLEGELGYDVSAQKAEIDLLIAKRFDVVLEEQAAAPNGDGDTKSTGTSVKTEVETDGDVTPSKPKKKRKASAEDDDRRLAAKLQAEWNAERRPSRNAAPKRKSAPMRKKKSSKQASDSDDAGEKKKRKVNKNNPFHAPLILSPALSEMFGETQLSRPETVKRIWKYIKEHSLQDQSDKRFINCDDALKSIFDSDRVHMFTMNKLLSTHLYPVDPSVKKAEDFDETVSFEEELQNGLPDEANSSF